VRIVSLGSVHIADFQSARRRPVPPQRVADVPPDQRKPVPGAYGAEMLTKKGVFGVVQGHQNRHLVIDPKSGAVGNIGSSPSPSPRQRSSALIPTAAINRPSSRARANRRHLPSTPTMAISGHWSRSATASATICRPTF
jgi:hypothetical protein